MVEGGGDLDTYRVAEPRRYIPIRRDQCLSRRRSWIGTYALPYAFGSRSVALVRQKARPYYQRFSECIASRVNRSRSSIKVLARPFNITGEPRKFAEFNERFRIRSIEQILLGEHRVQILSGIVKVSKVP